MESSTESQISYDASSSGIINRLMNERYNVEVHPPSMENSSMIKRMEFRDCGPSEVFIDLDMDKCFLSLTDTSSENTDKNSDENRGLYKSQVISLKSTRISKFAKRSSEIAVNH